MEARVIYRPDVEAESFIRQYHVETRRPGIETRLSAWARDPVLTEEELAYGARVAWRNSTRCIGRLPWAALQVRDRRYVTQPDEIFTELIEHLRMAYAGGKIRPVISVFGPGVRIVNDQLLRYAGYVQADGTVIGDPQNVALTQYLQKLGWAGGKGTSFDLLPVAIQSDTGRTELFTLPQDVTQEVLITHPDCPAIGDLGLRWPALPVISNMTLSVAGQHMTCAPFNGWYLQTEIAARNLADEHRYNMLPAVAQALGLDTSRRRSLWQDRALVELNVAVLHSFDQAGVRISDHHAVTRQFERFAAEEARAGRRVRGRWSWLIPPLSPATTPVWSRQYLDQEITPNFVRQTPAWTTPRSAARCPMHAG
ncbi:putative Nitric-oxide synthase [Deinococcus deserti VCD115]|uniref:Nitric oxide synthase oxygenase n=1 Tax=Deinococcus deserti (strain DSM 17065 / CIP 109153 / LMG 22923 / VCD115) TaxID=546414 RepID=C1CVN2_DEIDV|nr:putative Nitric-oxide synthase [Deinococcus deserti VCD115]